MDLAEGRRKGFDTNEWLAASPRLFVTDQHIWQFCRLKVSEMKRPIYRVYITVTEMIHT